MVEVSFNAVEINLDVRIAPADVPENGAQTQDLAPAETAAAPDGGEEGAASRRGEGDFAASYSKLLLQSLLDQVSGADGARAAQRIAADASTEDERVAAQTFISDGVHVPDGENVPYPEGVDAIEKALEYSEDVPGHAFDAFREIRDHKDNPTWLHHFFRTLGADKTAELMKVVPDYGLVKGGWGEQLGEVFATLVKGGKFNQADMDRLMKSVNRDGDSFALASLNLYLGESISRLPPNHRNNELKNMFFNSAARMATEDGRPQEVREALAAAATQALSTTYGDNQAVQLSRFRNEVGAEKFRDFIGQAMTGQSQLLDYDLGDYKQIGGVDRLLSTLAGLGGTGPGERTSLTQAELSALRTDAFFGASAALAGEETADKFNHNPLFKDSLSSIFMKEYDAILDQGLLEGGTPDPGNPDLNREFQNVYAAFLEHTLFSPPAGDKADDLMKFINAEYTEVANDLKTLDDAAFLDKYGQRHEDVARTLGELTGLFFKAMDNGLDDVWKDSQKAGESIETLLSVLPATVAGGVGALNAVAGVLATGAAEIVAKYGEDVADAFAKGEYEKAVGMLKDRGVDPRALIADLYHAIHDTVLPDDDEVPTNREGVSVKDAWQNGYDHIEGAPEVAER